MGSKNVVAGKLLLENSFIETNGEKLLCCI